MSTHLSKISLKKIILCKAGTPAMIVLIQVSASLVFNVRLQESADERHGFGQGTHCSRGGEADARQPSWGW